MRPTEEWHSADPIEALLLEVLERPEGEWTSALDAACEAHPEQAGVLRQRFAAMQRLGLTDAPAPDEIPERLGDFRLIERLGGGGMGVVYLADEESIGRRVALKVIRPECLYFPDARERFRREVAACAKLAHPGIVPVYAFGEADGVPYFTMERVRGRSLQEVILSLQTSPPELLQPSAVASLLDSDADPFGMSWIDFCVRSLVATAGALQHAHDSGVLHRDIKPGNLMVTSDGSIRVLDFGLSLTEGATRMTQSGSALGSLPYMAPEQVRGERVDRRADVYSLGVTAYELLSLTCPFLHERPDDVRAAIVHGTVVPLAKRNPAVPRDLALIVAKAMHVDRDRRYATCAEFAADLQRCAERRPVQARADSVAYRARRFVGRHPLPVAFGGVAVLASLVAAWTWWSQSERADDDLRSLHDAYDIVLQLGRELENLSGARPREIRLHEGFLETLQARTDAGDDSTEVRLLRAVTHIRLGRVLGDDTQLSEGRVDESREHYEDAEALAREVLAEVPGDRRARQYLALALKGLGGVAQASRMPQQALEYFEAALAGLDPFEDSAANQLAALLHINAGDQLGSQHFANLGDPDRARGHYERAAELAVELIEIDRRGNSRLPYLVHERLGDLEAARENLAGAREHWRIAARVAHERADARPTDFQAQRDAALCVERQARLAQEAGDFDAAIEQFGSALARLEPLRESNPTNASIARTVATERRLLAIAVGTAGLGESDVAARSARLREAIDLEIRVLEERIEVLRLAPLHPSYVEDLLDDLEIAADMILAAGTAERDGERVWSVFAVFLAEGMPPQAILEQCLARARSIQIRIGVEAESAARVLDALGESR